MKRREYRIGPGAASLLLVVVVVSLSVLALLALIDARADHKLAQRSIQFATSQYHSAAQAELRLAELDEILVSCAEKSQDGTSFWAQLPGMLPDGMSMEENVVSWEEESGSGTLYCSVEIQLPGTMPRYIWLEHAFAADIQE